MTKQLQAKDLESMSVQDLMNLNVDQVAEMTGFALYPMGLYAGNLVKFSIPDAAANPPTEYFEAVINPTAVIELSDPTEENLQLAGNLIATATPISARFYTKGGYGVAALRTHFGDLIKATADGNFGTFFAKCAQPGFQLPVNFIIDHRIVKPKVEGESAKTYTDVKNVMLAG
jgi:hypothetical protein